MVLVRHARSTWIEASGEGVAVDQAMEYSFLTPDDESAFLKAGGDPTLLIDATPRRVELNVYPMARDLNGNRSATASTVRKALLDASSTLSPQKDVIFLGVAELLAEQFLTPTVRGAVLDLLAEQGITPTSGFTQDGVPCLAVELDSTDTGLATTTRLCIDPTSGHLLERTAKVTEATSLTSELAPFAVEATRYTSRTITDEVA
jgi:hypothetical protein